MNTLAGQAMATLFCSVVRTSKASTVEPYVVIYVVLIKKKPLCVLQVLLQPVREALKLDGSNVTLQVMPIVRNCHTNPNNFERMRVNLAFQLFCDTVLNGLPLYKTKLEASWGSLEPVPISFG